MYKYNKEKDKFYLSNIFHEGDVITTEEELNNFLKTGVMYNKYTIGIDPINENKSYAKLYSVKLEK